MSPVISWTKEAACQTDVFLLAPKTLMCLEFQIAFSMTTPRLIALPAIPATNYFRRELLKCAVRLGASSILRLEAAVSLFPPTYPTAIPLTSSPRDVSSVKLGIT